MKANVEDGFLAYESVTINLIKYKGWSCNKDYSKKLMKI